MVGQGNYAGQSKFLIVMIFSYVMEGQLLTSITMNF